MLNLSQDDFLALGRQLVDAAIVAYSQALAAHATTINVPAPTAHPMIEMIVNQHGGQYAMVGQTTLDARLAAVELASGLAGRCATLEATLGLGLAAGATLAQRVSAIEAAASAKFA